MINYKHYSSNKIIQGTVQDSQECRILAVAPVYHALFLFCCVFAHSVHSYLYPFSIHSFLHDSLANFSSFKFKSRMTSFVKPSMTHLKDLGVYSAKFQSVPIRTTVLNHWFSILVTHWIHLGSFKCIDVSTPTLRDSDLSARGVCWARGLKTNK